jgi:hypothetical protein
MQVHCTHHNLVQLSIETYRPGTPSHAQLNQYSGSNTCMCAGVDVVRLLYWSLLYAPPASLLSLLLGLSPATIKLAVLSCT